MGVLSEEGLGELGLGALENQKWETEAGPGKDEEDWEEHPSGSQWALTENQDWRHWGMCLERDWRGEALGELGALWERIWGSSKVFPMFGLCVGRSGGGALTLLRAGGTAGPHLGIGDTAQSP